MLITKTFSFDAAHNLPWHEGKCKNLHGHTYKLEVTVEGDLNDKGVVIEFGDLKRIVESLVINKYDHKYLNDFFENPTVEVMLKKIWEELEGELNLKRVKLWETPTSYAELCK